MNTQLENLLEVTGLTKRYGLITVLDGCKLQIRAGEIHALIGANGAGKSTMVRMIAGLVSPTSGEMQLVGKAYEPGTKRHSESSGVQIVQQELNLISTLSVAENLFLTRLQSTCGVIHKAELHRQSRLLLDRFGLSDISTDTPAGSLGVGHQQMVEIAAALDQDCRLLILDEPTAALSAGETESLFEWLNRLREAGVGIIYISHRLDEVAQISNRVSVLRDGRSVGTFETSRLTTDDMVGLMSGEQPSQAQSSEYQSRSREQVALRVENLTREGIRDVSFEVNRGERLGIAGLVGSGRTELLRMIFGADRAETGQLFLGDRPERRPFRHPSEAVAAGIAMVTEDRKENGLLLSLSIRSNTTLASMFKRFSFGGLVRLRAEERVTQKMCESLETRCNNPDQLVETLSGGNQQKVAIAKWLVRDADVFLFDEPTRGIDVAARRRIYRLLDALSDDGKGLVIVSSDLDELLEICDRIAVMSNGRIVETFTRTNWSHERIMQAAFSGYLDRRSA